MNNPTKVVIAASIILVATTLLAGLTIHQRADETLRGINATIFATNVRTSYDMAMLRFNATLSNAGPLDIRLSSLVGTITIGGTPVYTGELGPITIKPDSSVMIVLTEDILAVPVAGEIFADIGSGKIRLGVTFTGVASAGGLTRGVTFSGSGVAAFWNRP
jgi:hypothetical protein